MKKGLIVFNVVLSFGLFVAGNNLIANNDNVAVQGLSEAAIDAIAKGPSLASANNALFATYGICNLKGRLFNILQDHTPVHGFRTNVASIVVASLGCLIMIGGLYGAYSIEIVRARDEGFLQAMHALGATGATICTVANALIAGGCLMAAGYLTLSTALSQLSEEEMQPMVNMLKGTEQGDIEKGLSDLRQWFNGIDQRLKESDLAQYLPLIDHRLNEAIAQVRDALDVQILVDQKRHASDKEVTEMQKRQTAAFLVFIERVLTILNDREQYVKAID